MWARWRPCCSPPALWPKSPTSAAQGIFALFDSCRTLAVHMYTLACEGLHVNEAYATSVVLLILVLLLNAAMRVVAQKMEVSKK